MDNGYGNVWKRGCTLVWCWFRAWDCSRLHSRWMDSPDVGARLSARAKARDHILGGKGLLTGTTVFVILALGVPIVIGLSLEQAHGILVGIQSYIFGFIGGMNLALYLWVRRLPK